MANIVVLGAGIGGLPCAYELKEKLGSEHEIILINANDYFQFVPSNPWVAVGWRDRERITFGIESYVSKKGIRFIHASCTKIDAEKNQLHLSNEQTIDYDFLVIATGPKLSFDEVEGAGPEGFSQSICTIDHAENAWQAYQQCLKEPGPIVIGAMPFASCFGPAYEFAFIVDSDLRKRKIRHKYPIHFVTSEPYIGHLGLGGVGDSKSLLESEFRNHHINWITNARTNKLEKGKLFCEQLNSAGEVEQTHELNFAFSMMIPAFKGIDPIAEVEGLANPRGFVIVDEYQRNPSHKNIYSAGVCIAIPPYEATPVPTGVPKTGYMIESMVTAIVHNIEAELNGHKADKIPTWNAICLADMGDTGAAFVAAPQLPPRNVAWMKKGKWVHLTKIAFEKYFIKKMKMGISDPSFERKILKMMGIEKLVDLE